jgi:hypothetical protein
MSSSHVSLRIDDDLLAAIDHAAEEEDRTRSYTIRRALARSFSPAIRSIPLTDKSRPTSEPVRRNAAKANAKGTPKLDDLRAKDLSAEPFTDPA